MEIYQDYGNDLLVTTTGDLQIVEGSQLSVQRIIRRLLTVPIEVSSNPDYIDHPTYGAGLPQFIGRLATTDIINEIKGLITSQMFLESSVAQNPPPEITISGLPSEIQGKIVYTNLITQQQEVVSFTYPPR